MHLDSHKAPILPDTIIHFKDERFKAYLIQNFDTDQDGEISTEEALMIRVVYCNNMHIKSLRGIEYFTNLKILYCSENHIKSLDLSQNTSLERVY